MPRPPLRCWTCSPVCGWPTSAPRRGGKTSQLAAALQGQGLLLANEFVAARAEILRQNLERMGVTNAVITNEDTARLAAGDARAV